MAEWGEIARLSEMRMRELRRYREALEEITRVGHDGQEAYLIASEALRERHEKV